MHRTCTRFNWGLHPPEGAAPTHMLCKQLVSATQGLQPKLVSSSDALLQPVLIPALALLLSFHFLCSMSSSPHCGSPQRWLCPPHTQITVSHLYFHAPCSPRKQVSLGKARPAQDGAEDHCCPPPAPCLDPSCSYSTRTFLLLLPRSPCRGFLAAHWSKLLAAH